MQNYKNTVQDLDGAVAVGASVLVNLGGTVTAATIYSDDGVTAAANPLTTDANGQFTFWAAPGLYDLVISGSTFPTRYWNGIQLYDLTGESAPWFDVKDAAYGAAGDGATDDAAAIQAAIDACEAAGGGVVWIPSGHYMIGSGLTILSSGVTVRGAGCGQEGSTAYGTVITPLTGAAAFGPMFTIGAVGSTTYGSGLQDLSLWGGRNTDPFAFIAQSLVLLINCRECFIERCRADLRCADDDARIAITIMALGALSSTANRITETHVQSPYKKTGDVNAYGYGVVFIDASTGFNTSNIIGRCKMYAGGPDNGGKIIEARTGCTFYMHDTQIDAGYNKGINAEALAGFFINNTIIDGGATGYDQITIAETARYCHFQGHLTDANFVDSNSNPNVKAWVIDTASRSGPSFPAVHLQPRTAAPEYADPGRAILEGSMYYNSTDQAPYVCTAGGETNTSVWTKIQLVGGSATDGVFPVDSYGAIPNDGTDDTAAIQAAIDACEAGGVGGKVVFSPGLYRITAGLTVQDNNIFLVGAGMSNEAAYLEGTTIMVDAGVVANFTMVTFGQAGSQLYGGGMKDIHLWSNNTATLNGGLSLVNVIEATFDNCRIDLRRVDADGRAAVQIASAAGGNSKLNRFHNCSIQAPNAKPGPADAFGYGLLLSRSGGSNLNNSFDGCWFFSASPVGGGHIVQTQDAGVGRTFFSNCHFQFATDESINLTGDTGNDCLVNCTIDSGASTALEIADGTPNCYFIGSADGTITDSNATESNRAFILNTAEANGPQFKALTVVARSAAPASPVKGTIYYDSDDDNLYVWTGAAWTDLTA